MAIAFPASPNPGDIYAYGGRQWQWNGYAWQVYPTSFTSGLTINATTISGGTSGRILYDNAGTVGELVTGTGVATAISNNINTSGGILVPAATLTANALLVGGGSGTGPSSITTGTGVITAIGNNTNGANGLAVLNGSGALAVGQGGTGTTTSFTQGSVIFAGSSGVYSQNNSKFFWDNTNNRLGIGTNTPGYNLDIEATSGNVWALAKTSDANGLGILDLDCGTNSYSIIRFMNNGSPISTVQSAVQPGTVGLVLACLTGQDIQFQTSAGVEKMRLTTSGSLGVGELTPDSYGKITVRGTTNSGTATFLSGATGSLSSLNIGRTTRNFTLATAAGANQFFTNVTANDNVIAYGAGSLFIGTGNIDTAGTAAAVFDSNGILNVCSAVATPAGGSTTARLVFGTTAGFGIYYGSGAPTVSAAQGSIYLRSDGSSTSTRMYVNTNGSTGWTNLVTAT